MQKKSSLIVKRIAFAVALACSVAIPMVFNDYTYYPDRRYDPENFKDCAQKWRALSWKNNCSALIAMKRSNMEGKTWGEIFPPSFAETAIHEHTDEQASVSSFIDRYIRCTRLMENAEIFNKTLRKNEKNCSWSQEMQYSWIIKIRQITYDLFGERK